MVRFGGVRCVKACRVVEFGVGQITSLGGMSGRVGL